MNFIEQLKGKKALIYVGLCIYFFATYLYITPDSVQFYSYLDFFNGIRPLSEWFPTRGWSLPLLLWIGYKISISGCGILIVFCVLYIGLINGMWTFASRCVVPKKSCEYWSLIFAFVFLLIFNPIIYVMAHAILTEFPVAVLTFLCLYICGVFMYIRVHKEKIPIFQYIIYVVICSILSIVVYQLKAMYFPIVIVLWAGSEVLIWIKKNNFRTILQSCGMFILLLAIFFAGQYCFNKVIENEVVYHPEAQIIGGLRYFEIDGAEHKDGSTQVQNYIEGTRTVCIKDDQERTIDSFEYTFEASFSNHLNFVKTCFEKNPGRFFAGYFDNYMLLCDFYGRPRDPQNETISYLTGNVKKGNVFLNLFADPPNLNQELVLYASWLQADIDTEQKIENYQQYNWFFWNDYVTNFREINSSCIGKLIGKDIVVDIFILVFAVIIFLSPIRTIYYLIKYIKSENNLYYSVQFLINLTIFSQIVFFSLAGTIVDRYMYPSYLIGIFGMVIRIAYGIKNRNECMLYRCINKISRS